MKIITYNINGIRASAKLGIADYFKTCGADIICLQETRAQQGICNDLVKDCGYEIICNSAKRLGYSGTMVLTKLKPSKINFGLNEDDEEGRTITLFYNNFILVNCYVPNGNSRLEFKLEFVKKLIEYVDDLQKIKPVILCADMNTAQTEKDLSHPKVCSKRSGYLLEERNVQAEIFNRGFLDVHRCLHPNELLITWRSYRSRMLGGEFGWKFRFDYILVSKILGNKLISTQVPDLEYSDHLPIILDLENP